MTPSVAWKRVRRALLHYTRNFNIDPTRVDLTMNILPTLIGMCGSFSASRRSAYRIGVTLVQDQPQARILCCPDYSNRNSRFTYQGLGDGVPMLVNRHGRFMSRVCAIVPNLQVMFLIADHEANSAPLRRIMGVTKKEFQTRVERSIAAARSSVACHGWDVRGFTDEIPDFHDREAYLVRSLKADERLRRRFASETVARAGFYRKVGYRDPAQWRERTYHNAAQYILVGEHLTRHNLLACNHHTASLSWFMRTGTAFLDNPIRIY